MKIRTALIREREIEGEQDIEAALAEAAHFDEGFAVLSGDDDSFVQFDGAKLERGENGRLWRLDVDRAAREVFNAFAAGKPLPENLAWRDVTDELSAKAGARRGALKRGIFFALVIGLVVGAIFAIGYVLMERATGG